MFDEYRKGDIHGSKNISHTRSMTIYINLDTEFPRIPSNLLLGSLPSPFLALEPSTCTAGFTHLTTSFVVLFESPC